MAAYCWVDDLSHLWAECLCTEISSILTLSNEYRKPVAHLCLHVVHLSVRLHV